MPILQRIELSNFMNSTRAKPWRPDWPHQIFELNGENAALNIPNGKGKSTMVTAILSMLTYHTKSLKDIRNRFFSPVQAGHYTHIRIQVLIPMEGASGDLIEQSGGDFGGQPMVFGMYGYSGENEKLESYSYQGTFEDAPVAHVHNHHHTLVDDDAFLGQLKTCARLFPGNAKERTKRAWLSFVDDFFDKSSLDQQLKYQLMRGAEGGHGYFEVKPPVGMNYSAAIFYERLAPELLTDVMGDLGEENEHGIEDTIHEKVSKIIAAKYQTEKKAEELRRTENTLRELATLLDSSSKMKVAKEAYDLHRKEFSVELAVLKNVVVDDPIPGIPRVPPESVPEIARLMVMQDGKWYLPDRVMAEFTGEPSSAVNQRAQERNGLHLEHASKSQLIDFTCYSFSGGKRGPSGSLYPRESALGLLNITSNFAKDWTRERAIEVITQAFDWVEANADTNPARILHKALDVSLEAKNREHKELSDLFTGYQKEKEDLLTEQTMVGTQQAEYRRMADSNLFTAEELAEPKETGARAHSNLTSLSHNLEQHKDNVRKLSNIFQSWQSFVAEFGEGVRPEDKAAEIESQRTKAKDVVDEIQRTLKAAREHRKSFINQESDARRKLEAAETKLSRFIKSLPAHDQFIALFGDIAPTGMEITVVGARDNAITRLKNIATERALYNESLNALARFRAACGNVLPGEWLTKELAIWQALSEEMAQLNKDLAELRRKRSDLDSAVIVAGQFARKAAQVAGGDHLPLHAAIERMKMDDAQRAKVLTLFSALLHTPVYQTVEEAAEAAERLENADIEIPVFVYAELEKFCQTGEITLDAVSAHTWLVGVRTRQVECLLDPSLVEREKSLADERIATLLALIQVKVAELAIHAPDGDAANTARLASDAVSKGYEDIDKALSIEASALTEQLPNLKIRASEENINVIRQAEQHYTEFKEVTESELQIARDECQVLHQNAIHAAEQNESEIEQAERDLSKHQESLNNAIIAASKLDALRQIQAFIDHPEFNPAFMLNAGQVEKDLAGARTIADQRTRFQFEHAEIFVKQGYDRPKQIESRLKHVKDEQDEIQNRLLPVVNQSILALQERIPTLIKNAMEIDEFTRGLIRKYRDFAVEEEELLEISQTQIERHSLGGAAIGLRENVSLDDMARMLLDIAGDIQLDESGGMKAEINRSRSEYLSAKTSFSALVDRILVMGNLDLTEHVKLELVRAKDNIAIVERLHSVATLNYEKNSVANTTAKAYLDEEWANIGKWLKAFTQRLPDNLRTLKNVFGPLRDKATGEYLSAGFEIEAKLADQDDIRAILDDVVKMVEKFESTRHAVENVSPDIGIQAIKSIRTEIRNTFYQKVILNPRIRVYMPSISKQSLPLEKDMVSTGQGVAMTLLWVVKMADYVTEREIRRVTTSRAQQKHLHPTQFAIMDGAFSSLSNKGLIQDALDCIKRTRGRFQLIITGHDENYQNNFEYFPTLIEAREINGQFMYADSTTRRILQPNEVGSHYGAMEVMSLRVLPHQLNA